MATRDTFNGSSIEVPWANTGSMPEGFGDEYARHLKTLYDAANFPLAGIGGTADDVTASVDPVLQAGLMDGMKFTLTWGADNTGPMTLSINGGPQVDILMVDGSTVPAGTATAGGRALVEYAAGDFVMLSGGGSGGGSTVGWDYQVFTVSGAWLKPAGLDDNRTVLVQAWGGGGGSASGAGRSIYGGGGGSSLTGGGTSLYGGAGGDDNQAGQPRGGGGGGLAAGGRGELIVRVL